MKTDSRSSADTGSYRDPDSFVFYDNERVYRALSADSGAALDRAWQAGVLGDLVKAGLVAKSDPLPKDGADHARLAARFPGWPCFVAHERIPFISYPYEWSYSMLADAAKVQLQIQRDLLRHGLSLKDATAFNIQFKGANPIFIDLGSIEVPARLDVWVAYSQFCRMFLFPLLLFAHRGLDFRQSFLGAIEGPSVDQVFVVVGRARAMLPDMFLDVFLQHALGARGKAQARALRLELAAGGRGADVQMMNLQRLSSKIEKLRRSLRLSGQWVDYQQDNTYSDAARDAKIEFVKEFMRECRPPSVLDLGCNTGEYSVLCAREGARVVAVDGDHDCVEKLYQRAAGEGLDILPLLIDLANPSPGLGFMNRERRSFLERARCDSVLALALVHHLLITARLPLQAICDLMAALTSRHLVIEFVEREDEMFQTLLALRKDLYADLTLDAFLDVFGRTFRLLKKTPVPGARRHLLLFELIEKA